MLYPTNRLTQRTIVGLIALLCTLALTVDAIRASSPSPKYSLQSSTSSVTPTPDEFEAISSGEISAAAWTRDNRLFVFDHSQPTIDQTTWSTFDVQTRTVTDSQIWPLLPPLTSTEVQSYGLTIENYQVGKPFYFLSPDGKILVFARQSECGEFTCLYHLVLGDRKTKQVFDTKSTVYYPFRLNAFRVLWNHSGSAFVLMQAEDFGGQVAFPTTYVFGFTHGIANTHVTNAIRALQIGGRTYNSRDAFMFSAADTGIFIGATDVGNSRSALIEYSVIDPAKSHLITDHYTDGLFSAGFAPNSEDKILMFTSTGLVQYDLTSDEILVLNDKLNTTSGILGGWFSPNGEWFAVNARSREIYVLRLATQTEGIFTPTALVSTQAATAPGKTIQAPLSTP